MKNVTILNFSSRENGNCAKIADFIKNHHSEDAVEILQIDAHFAACGGCDYECLQPGVMCPNVDDRQKQIMDRLLQSDLTYQIIPNYCGFPCANFFTFNERSIGFFNMDRNVMAQYMAVEKRFVIVSNSENASFDQAMRLQTKGEPDVIYLKTSKYGKRSTAGDLMDSSDAQSDLATFLTKSR